MTSPSKKMLALVACMAALAQAQAALRMTCGKSVPGYKCVNSKEAEALEVKTVIQNVVYASSGDKPMSQDEFAALPPQVGQWQLNTPRGLLFDSCFWRSVSKKPQCRQRLAKDPMACVWIRTIPQLGNTTWLEMAGNLCGELYPATNSSSTLGASPSGTVTVAVIDKCQNMTWTSKEVWTLTDEWANTYIMHASGAMDEAGTDAAVKAAVYPKGWSAKKVKLDPNPFTIWPYYTDDGRCLYTIIRDSTDNSWHQIGCSSATRPTDVVPSCKEVYPSSSSTKRAAPAPKKAAPAPSKKP